MERVRKHANPFSVRVELERLDRKAIFGRVGALEVELGSGAGGFLIDRASNEPSIDFVGFEIRKPLVLRAEACRKERGLRNLTFVFANGIANLDRAFAPGSVSRFHVHFPDPCPKKRHFKRRILSPKVARELASLLCVGGEIYAQSDVPELAFEMADFLAADGSFEERLDPRRTNARPIPESTEWERHHESRGEPIHRLLFVKAREPRGPIPELPFRRVAIPNEPKRRGRGGPPAGAGD